MNDNFRGVSRRLMCLQISRQWWIYLCASLRGRRRGACIFCFLYLTLTTFKRNGCLSGVPIEEWCVLNHSSIIFFSNFSDVLGTLVRLSESDRPSGIQVEVLRAVQNMVILLDEQFLVHSVVHKAVLRLLRTCVGDDIQEQLDNKNRKVMGAAKNIVRSSPSEYEEDREFLPISITAAHSTPKHSCQSPMHTMQPHPDLSRTSHNLFSRQARVSI
jgi:hypothetical protein